MKPFKTIMLMAMITSSGLVVSFGATDQTSFVVDAGGGTSSNAFFSGVSAVGQGTPIGLTANAAFANYSGFLNTFVARPDLDHDTDGVVDENDPDDNNDGLTDLAELEGSAFDPATSTDVFHPDTDGDGAGDRDESVAETNPRDPNSVLALRGEFDGANELIEWKSREGKTYELLRSSGIFELATAPQTTDVVTVLSGGVGPFKETTTVRTNEPPGEGAYYRVKALP